MGTAAYKKEISIATSSTATFNPLPATTGDLSNEGTVLDDTDLTSSGYRSRILGLLDWNVSVTCNLSSGGNQAISDIKDARLNRNNVFVRYLPIGSSMSSLGYEGEAVVENFNLSGGVDDLETVDISLQADGELYTPTA